MVYPARFLSTTAMLFALAGCNTWMVKPGSSDSAQTHGTNGADSAHPAAAVSLIKTDLNRNPELINKAVHVPAKVSDESTGGRASIASLLSGAISHLGQGEINAAEATIEQVLLADPDNANALFLLEQIESDPVAQFGPESVAYTVKPGDSMSSLADRFLNNHQQFFLLARYSGIRDPSSLRVGQTIRIPARYAAALEKAQRRNNLLHIARSFLQRGQNGDVIHLFEVEHPQLKVHRSVRNVLGEAYAGAAGHMEASGDLDQALIYLKKAQTLRGGHEGTASAVQRLENEIEFASLMRLAKLHLKAGQVELALNNITASLAIKPSSRKARALARKIQTRLLEGYDRTELERVYLRPSVKLTASGSSLR